MQTQTRGKKRGAKENVTAVGKKAKKEEEPKPFVCAIYRRDIASFLPRDKIQQWRLTSSHSNASLIEFPSLLPRFKYHGLTVIFVSGDQCVVQKTGFLHYQSDGYSMDGKEFNTIFNFRFCCRDVRDSASKLVGQRLFPSKLDNEGVAFKLYVDQLGREVVCRALNLLTKKTAPVMLHFLHHLNQACYKHIEIMPGPTADAAECEFNLFVLQVLPKFRLRGVKFGREIIGKLSNLTVEMTSRMRIRFNMLFYRGFYYFPQDLPQLLDFIANGRQLDKGLELQASIRLQDVDRIIKYFEGDVHSLEGAIRDVRCESHANFKRPSRCPKEAATLVTRNDDGTVDYRFNYSNAHSGEPFSLLLLGTRRYEGRTLIRKFHLKFG